MTEAHEGRALPGASPFAGDDGSADPELATLLMGYAAGTATLTDVVVRLAKVRVLIPILAELDVAEQGDHGFQVDKQASAGVVALEAPDGRKALPVFSSVASMSAWRHDARPVPADAVRAALSAVAEDWALLVLDPGGPVSVLVPRPAVWAIAQGKTWLPAVEGDVVAPEIAQAIVDAVSPVGSVARVSAAPGRTAEVAVRLGIDSGLTRARLTEVLAEVNAALGASKLVSERVDSLELRIGRAD
ncbi:SseB protein N-terminal domain-containing protein [Sanguibacter gelidistatuariae]|uniref:SseB protein N-terminal domain-containing protein n=1 Tax=Sanguibacter gelidistatuariae TaxID=1814289 RepID=A0A1G6P279_9MICO|nr:SseB family protein [Sanguibacter gelidistatuariae]SDC73596.1 SseB protein N-terminal domain-containing protein [Sanguibacter gelidistatuariae]